MPALIVCRLGFVNFVKIKISRALSIYLSEKTNKKISICKPGTERNRRREKSPTDRRNTREQGGEELGGVREPPKETKEDLLRAVSKDQALRRP